MENLELCTFENTPKFSLENRILPAKCLDIYDGDTATFGVIINCIAPGATLTGRFRATLQNRSKEDKEKIMSKGKSILTRPAEPEYISSVVNFLLSDESKYISGQVIRIDGGQLTSPI